MDNKIILELLKASEPVEPETLDMLASQFTPEERERFLTIKAIMLVNTIFEDCDAFENAVQVLNKIKPDVFKMEGCTPEHVWYALLEIHKLRPKMEYSSEVKSYIKFIFKDNGFTFYPPLSGIEQNDSYKNVLYITENGPFPLKETKINIQVLKYLKIVDYMESMK